MKLNTNIKIKGEITAKFWQQKNPLLKRWNILIEKLIKLFPKQRKNLLKYYSLGELVKVERKTNIICNAGFSRVCGVLTNDLSIANGINYMLLGTGSGTPAVGDTTLFTEAYRNATGSGTYQDNIAYLTAYYTQTEVTGTFTEFGNAIDGSASADSGYLWSHIAGLNWVKDNTTSLVVDCKYTMSSS